MRRIAAVAAAGSPACSPGAARRRSTGAQSAPAPNAPAVSPVDVPRDSEEAHLGTITADPDIDTSTADASTADTSTADTTAADAWTRPAAPMPQHAGATTHRSSAQAPAASAPKGTKADAAAHQTFTEVPARSPQLVMARPGMAGLHSVRWQSATVLDPRTVRVRLHRWRSALRRPGLGQGRLPDRRRGHHAVLRLRPRPAGPDVRRGDPSAAVDVHLASAVAGRRIEDGAAPAPAAPTAVTAPVAEVPQPGPDDGATQVYAQHNTADAHPVRWDAAKPIARR